MKYTPNIQPISPEREEKALSALGLPNGFPVGVRGYVPSLVVLGITAAARYGITSYGMLSSSKSNQCIKARDELIWNARHYGYSTNEIGMYLGNRHHTTILHSIKKTGATVGEAYK